MPRLLSLTKLTNSFTSGNTISYFGGSSGKDNWGEGTSTLGSANASAAANTPPVITLPKGVVDLLYVEADGPKAIDNEATVTDSDSANFDNGKLTITLTNATANDRLAITNQGSGTGEIGVSGNDVSYEGTPIGSFTTIADATTPSSKTNCAILIGVSLGVVDTFS